MFAMFISCMRCVCCLRCVWNMFALFLFCMRCVFGLRCVWNMFCQKVCVCVCACINFAYTSKAPRHFALEPLDYRQHRTHDEETGTPLCCLHWVNHRSTEYLLTTQDVLRWSLWRWRNSRGSRLAQLAVHQKWSVKRLIDQKYEGIDQDWHRGFFSVWSTESTK